MTSTDGRVSEVAVIIPCYNEQECVASVIHGIRESLPNATVYVYDNASTDRTAEVAREAGAIVCREELKGKGNVVRRAFADVEADVYLMIDGDDTYDPTAASRLVEKLQSGPYDHVLGVRRPVHDGENPYRAGHAVGNRMLNRIVRWIFGGPAESDMLSGYRAMSRRFVKSFPAMSREFEIETELTVHTLALRVPHASVSVGFQDRPPGSLSKLRTYHDGMKILRLIASLARHEKPIAVYGALSALAALVALVLGLPVLTDYAESGLVARMPSLFVAATFGTLALLLLIAGLILDGIRKSRHEAARLRYLNLSPWREESATRADSTQVNAVATSTTLGAAAASAAAAASLVVTAQQAREAAAELVSSRWERRGGRTGTEAAGR